MSFSGKPPRHSFNMNAVSPTDVADSQFIPHFNLKSLQVHRAIYDA